MSSGGDDSPRELGIVATETGTSIVTQNAELPPATTTSMIPSVSSAEHQEVVNALWPVLMKEVEGKMVHMEQELIKRHNIKMMNEMQEVVRQIKQAKTKNDEILRDYHKKQTDLTRSVLEIAEKFAQLRSDVDEIKRQNVINKQQLVHRCDQNAEQVSQLKQAVLSAWQREKSEMQQTISQNFRTDLALVLNQFDGKLRDNFNEISKLRFEIRKLTAQLNGEEFNPTSEGMPQEHSHQQPLSFDHQSNQQPNQQPQQTSYYTETTLPSQLSAGGPSLSSLSSSTGPSSSHQPSNGGLTGLMEGIGGITPQQQSGANISSPSLSSQDQQGVNLASLTQNLAAFIARQQSASGSTGPPQVNVQMLQQFMQTLPRQQQLQLQMLLQQHRAAQQQPKAPTVTSPAVTAQSPVVAHPAGPAAASAPPAGGAAAAAASMIQSLAQQLQLQVNTAQQRAATSAPGSVNCPYFSMFGWCKFSDRCRFAHNPTGKEPLRNLPQPVIQTLQNQLSSGSTELTTQTLMTALAGVAAKQQAASQQTVMPPPGLSTPAVTSVQQAMIQAQIQAQQEAAQMGAAKAKQIACKFFAIGRCAYGDRCAYNHAAPVSSAPTPAAAAAAAAWGKSGLQQSATWSVGAGFAKNVNPTEESGDIVDGEDDTNYDQWNALTFEDESGAGGPPPGL